ncbi:MAG: hypothetical protein HZY76_00880 [Anaerolineae bacterium]|nr:MAG: hypothetical protein HZY76_00880 [Anaerolineae bacterium]
MLPANAATILNGGYVGNTGQYWLVVQAPAKPGAPTGAEFDLTVRLGGAITATEVDAIRYDELRSDRVLVIDRSGSMAGDKLLAARDAARFHTEDLVQPTGWGCQLQRQRDRRLPAGRPGPPARRTGRGRAPRRTDSYRRIGGRRQHQHRRWPECGPDRLDAVGSDNAWWIVLLSDGMENSPSSTTTCATG